MSFRRASVGASPLRERAIYGWKLFSFLNSEIFIHAPCSGNLQSQNNQPSMGVRVMVKAAWHGETNSFSLRVKAPFLTLP